MQHVMDDKMILVTGGAGYIGSHTCVELANSGYKLVVLDNLSNSSAKVLPRIESIIQQKITFVQGDIRHRETLEAVFRQYNIAAVIHFAGLKTLNESVSQPMSYYDNNVSGTITLCNVMAEFDCKTLIFSSSAAVYAEISNQPIREDFPLAANNPYGRSKLIIEQILTDLHRADPAWSIALLRYFNPVGAHFSGLIGEHSNATSTNLMPCLSQVATGKRDKLFIYGNDYKTRDGTGVRDYIHVADLAKAHVKALIKALDSSDVLTLNIGTGRGYSVLEVIAAFEKVSGQKIPFEMVARRAKDLARCVADPSLAIKTLNWKAELDINRMCADSWHWQTHNPDGYA
ncbi:UDP-glucose 4-epimerase GalE [Methylophaga sp. UBA1464]|uniref:UDP-glucose 4-epimerase GalE n=1 Tax=Methylophaga sp. UBA1464 TaxID=1946866 RepID=UPI0025FCE52F|nr:UDP-glucose 4-epimerase GalE [Methylophaga sp. UBA1464]